MHGEGTVRKPAIGDNNLEKHGFAGLPTQLTGQLARSSFFSNVARYKRADAESCSGFVAAAGSQNRCVLGCR